MERVVADMRIEDCDQALALLRSLADEPSLREVARLSIDDVLDRRNELVAGLCRDCGFPVSAHEVYRDGRCPVVRVDCEDGA